MNESVITEAVYDQRTGDLVDKKPLKGISQFTYSAKTGSTEFYLILHCLAKFVDEVSEDLLILKTEASKESPFESGYPLLANGIFVFNYKGKIISCETSSNTLSVTFNSSHTELLAEIKERFLKYLKYKNPIRGKFLSIFAADGNLGFTVKDLDPMSFDGVIMNEDIKEDIYDNTIFHLKEFEGSNGIILHGPPGTGKTLCCQSLAHQATQAGYSCLFATSSLHFPHIDVLTTRYTGDTMVIFEDVDSFGYSRDLGLNQGLSNFLQFVNGLSAKKEKMALIATTNHLEELDNAIKNRPMRFNRKYHINFPANDEIDRLIKLYFDKIELTDEQIKNCYEKQWTGAHFRELRRTSDLICKKKGVSVKVAFDEAVKKIDEIFSMNVAKHII